MQHRYASGEIMRLGDRVRENSTEIGTVVALIDSGLYAEGFQREHWDHYKTGVLLSSPKFGLTMYQDPEHMAYFEKVG